MRWSRAVGLVATVLVAVILLGSVSQLGISIFDHGGVIPSLFIVAAFVVIVARIGIRDRQWLANTYW